MFFSQNVTDYAKESTRETQENFANFDDFNKFENTTASHSNENIARFSHKRSASLDSAHVSRKFIQRKDTAYSVFHYNSKFLKFKQYVCFIY